MSKACVHTAVHTYLSLIRKLKLLLYHPYRRRHCFCVANIVKGQSLGGCGREDLIPAVNAICFLSASFALALLGIEIVVVVFFVSLFVNLFIIVLLSF